MRSRHIVGGLLLALLTLSTEAQGQALADTTVSITNATSATVTFSLGAIGEPDTPTGKKPAWIDATLKSRETKAYQIQKGTMLRIAVTSGGFRTIRYYAMLPGERYRIGVEDQLYDLRQLHPRDQGETKLTPAKEDKEEVIPKPPKEPVLALYLLAP